MLTALASVFPIYWTFVVASSTNDVIADVPPPFVPGGHLMENVRNVFDNDAANFSKALINTAIVAAVVSLSVLVFSSLAGFAFAKLRFRGRNVLLAARDRQPVDPDAARVIPLYILMGKIGWNGDLKAVIVPFLVSAFGVFFMRQCDQRGRARRAARRRPDRRLRDCCGCGHRRRPGRAAGGGGARPVHVHDDLERLPLAAGDADAGESDRPGLAVHAGIGLLPATTRSSSPAPPRHVPLLILFFVAGRQLIAGIMEGAVKG